MMVIELDEQGAFEFSPEMVARITRPRAIAILNMIVEAREVIIQTHPEPDTLRATYGSRWFKTLVEAQPEVIDPNGTIRFLQRLDALFDELGVEDSPPAGATLTEHRPIPDGGFETPDDWDGEGGDD